MRRSTRARKLHDFPLINLICTNRTDGTGRKKGTLRDSPWKWKIAGNGHAAIRIAKSLCDIYHSRVSIVLSFTRNRNKEHLGSTSFYQFDRLSRRGAFDRTSRGEVEKKERDILRVYRDDRQLYENSFQLI